MQETGEALDEVLSGILPAILMALAIVAGCTLVGLSLGALGGAVAGVGVGDVPGVIAGSSTGFTAGLWILEWMGLAFLAVHVGKNMYQVTRLVESGFNDAWGTGARNVFGLSTWDTMHYGHDKIPGFSQVMAASRKFARAVAVLIRLVLEGVVLYLTARGVAKLPELVSQLRNSRLGEGFAVWVEKNHQNLMSNPKLRQSAGAGGVAAKKPVRILTDHTTVKEQPRPKRIKKTTPVDTITKIKNTTATARGTKISAQRVLPGTSDNVAVIGRNMDAVKPFADALGKQGIEVETFSGSKISDAANKEFFDLSELHNGNIPNDALVNTKMFSENKAWVEGIMNKGGTVADIGNPCDVGKSVFYEMEKSILFGGTK
jgi:hypothetical protein